ncbi:g10080 [Coccomyxa elongata]
MTNKFIFPSLAWGRFQTRLTELYPDVRVRAIVLGEIHKLPLERRLDYFVESSDYVTLGMLQSLCGPDEQGQTSDASNDRSSSVMASERAPSLVSASKLTVNELKLLKSMLKCAIIPTDRNKTVFADLQESGLEYECYSTYIQVFTDFIRIRIIRRQFFAGMPALYDFLNRALAAVPARMVGFHTDGRRIDRTAALFSKELQQPRRRKLGDPVLQDPEAMHDMMKRLCAAMEDDDTPDPDEVLADWFPHGGDEPIRFPDEPSSQPCPS